MRLYPRADDSISQLSDAIEITNAPHVLSHKQSGNYLVFLPPANEFGTPYVTFNVSLRLAEEPTLIRCLAPHPLPLTPHPSERHVVGDGFVSNHVALSLRTTALSFAGGITFVPLSHKPPPSSANFVL